MPDQLVIVSFYEPRPLEPLTSLIASLARFDAGCPYDMAIVVNRTGSGPLQLPATGPGVRIIERANGGMNIGAWDHGWRESPGYDGYLFLQDECVAQRDEWLSAFRDAARSAEVGLLGESWNSGWDRPWDDLRHAVAGQVMKDHWIDGAPGNRVDVYRGFLEANGVEPGLSAGHLRSLVWYARRPVLERMGGFLHGANYGECIAAEIGATKRVEQLGWRAAQVDVGPFSRFRHLEWREVSRGRWKHVPHDSAPHAAARPNLFARVLGRFGL